MIVRRHNDRRGRSWPEKQIHHHLWSTSNVPCTVYDTRFTRYGRANARLDAPNQSLIILGHVSRFITWQQRTLSLSRHSWMRDSSECLYIVAFSAFGFTALYRSARGRQLELVGSPDYHLA